MLSALSAVRASSWLLGQTRVLCRFMDTSWPNEALSCAAQFHELYDDLLSFDAPASKVGPQPTSREALPVTVQQVQAAEMNRKRKLELAEKESLELFLTQLGSEEAVGASGGLADLDVGLKHKGSDEKEAKMDTARNKACRERARRERLNDRCSFSRKAVLGLAAHAQQRLQCQAHTQFLVHVSCAQHHDVPQLRRALQGFGPSQGRQD